MLALLRGGGWQRQALEIFKIEGASCKQISSCHSYRDYRTCNTISNYKLKPLASTMIRSILMAAYQCFAAIKLSMQDIHAATLKTANVCSHKNCKKLLGVTYSSKTKSCMLLINDVWHCGCVGAPTQSATSHTGHLLLEYITQNILGKRVLSNMMLPSNFAGNLVDILATLFLLQQRTNRVW